MDDQQLVQQFLKRRSEQAFSALYDTKTPQLYQIALLLTVVMTFMGLVQLMPLCLLNK